MILPIASSFEQGTAHFRAVRTCPLPPHLRSCKVAGVMVARPRAQSIFSACYPSPAGRCGCPQGCAPCFFPATGGGNSLSGDLAARPLMSSSWHIGVAKTARNKSRHKSRRGKETCKQLQNGLRPSARQHFSVGAETRLASRPSWAAEQVLRRRLSPKATLPQAQLSVPSATWPIASNTRHAAKGVATALRGARNNLKPASEFSDAGFFCDQTHDEIRARTIIARTKEGTDHV